MATPVSGEETVVEMAALADEVVILEQPRFFGAVAQVYKKWYDVLDKEVMAIMGRWADRSGSKV